MTTVEVPLTLSEVEGIDDNSISRTAYKELLGPLAVVPVLSHGDSLIGRITNSCPLSRRLCSTPLVGYQYSSSECRYLRQGDFLYYANTCRKVFVNNSVKSTHNTSRFEASNDPACDGADTG